MARLVDRLAQLHRRLGDVLDAGADLFGAVALEIVLERGDGQLDRLDGRRVDLVGVLFHRLLGRVDEALGLVLRLDQLAALLVGLGVGLGVLDHLLDLVVRQTARRLDRDLLLLVGALVLGGHRHDAVGVDVEGHLDLGHAAGCGRNVLEVELTEHLVVGRHLALALEDPDRHRVLVVLGGGEDLALLRRDRRVAVDQAGEDTAQRLDAERQRRDVEQDHVLDVALQDTGLDGGAERDDLIGVDALVRLLAEELGHFLDDLGHAGHAADEDDFVDVGGRQAGILERRLAGLHRRLDQVAHEALELGAGQLHDHVQRLAGGPVHRDERLVDLGLAGARQLDLGFLGGFLEPLQGHLVLRQVDAVFLFELVGEVVDDAHVEVFTAEERVAVRRLHLEQAVVDLEDGDVEGTAAEVVDRDRAGFLLVETVGQRGGGGLVDDAQHLEAGDLAGVLRGLALGVVEVGRDGDDSLVDVFAEVGFCGFLHLLQDEGGNLGGAVLLVPGLDPGIALAAVDDVVRQVLLVLGEVGVVQATADQALHAENGVVGVGHGLPLGGLAHETLVLGEGDDGRGRPGAFGVLDHSRLRPIHDGDAGVGGPKVDTDDFGHSFQIPLHSGGLNRAGPPRHPAQ
ncbi:putative NAD-specific glutamate dehydrogenase encoded in antisense gene pair with dnaKJ [Oceanicola granulosus HTCC2516]|uniref:Putative NAD-specific glutamate dehydrogenase encoded in antisense gene pair with dnaKJ n=1 Tax=Oceanicola granulosus (strain ATCC BAA-861 / DSM 15982 / KCTC 12143 / HTCC2516) TaxID=314256 RepID=Q2CJY4_OCEGH|nr:putative NAD-specific glutamate dehydrogenase encoded in antisense gene pair with dnaKJ [Oceanicola granulosus HTCC2516]